MLILIGYFDLDTSHFYSQYSN